MSTVFMESPQSFCGAICVARPERRLARPLNLLCILGIFFDPILSRIVPPANQVETALLDGRLGRDYDEPILAIVAERTIAEQRFRGPGLGRGKLLGVQVRADQFSTALGWQLYCRPYISGVFLGWQYNCHPNKVQLPPQQTRPFPTSIPF
jgi:hypothetical protein